MKKFLEKEHEIFQRAGVFSPEDSEPEPLASNGDSSLLSDPRVEVRKSGCMLWLSSHIRECALIRGIILLA